MCSPGVDARLNTDDQSSFGPEIVTVDELHNGIYHYSVHHFTGGGNISASGANVTLSSIARGPYAGKVFSLRPPAGGWGKNDQWILWDIVACDNVITNITTVNRIERGVDSEDDRAFSP